MSLSEGSHLEHRGVVDVGQALQGDALAEQHCRQFFTLLVGRGDVLPRVQSSVAQRKNDSCERHAGTLEMDFVVSSDLPITDIHGFIECSRDQFVLLVRRPAAFAFDSLRCNSNTFLDGGFDETRDAVGQSLSDGFLSNRFGNDGTRSLIRFGDRPVNNPVIARLQPAHGFCKDLIRGERTIEDSFMFQGSEEHTRLCQVLRWALGYRRCYAPDQFDDSMVEVGRDSSFPETVKASSTLEHLDDSLD
jgi:hypothetical protein